MSANKHLIISGVLFSVVLFTWPILMGMFHPSGTVEEQLIGVSDNISFYKIQFFFAFLISPSIVYMMLSQLNKFPEKNKLSTGLGNIFISVYVVLNCISYGSQVVLVPGFIEQGDMAAARNWYFGSSVSVSYFLNQTGYFFWAVGTIILFIRFLKNKGYSKYIGIIYLISAILSIFAFMGLLINNSFINSITLVSGLVLLPVGILTVIWGYNGKRLKFVHPVNSL
jgi:hypothetical protein